MLIKVHKDKLTFKNNFLKTEKGRETQKHGDYYKQIKASIEKHGILNPLICVQDGDTYKICLGIKRYIIGCDLGMEEFEIKVIPKDESKFLKEENFEFVVSKNELAREIPIIDRNSPQKKYPREYIPIPSNNH